MLFMVIERFRPEKFQATYARFQQHGRMMPYGLRYVSSWIDADLTRCFQVMETDDRKLLDEWMSRWQDLMEFEVIPVITSSEAAQKALNGSNPAAG
jgi:hypothetical protein